MGEVLHLYDELRGASNAEQLVGIDLLRDADGHQRHAVGACQLGLVDRVIFVFVRLAVGYDDADVRHSVPVAVRRREDALAQQSEM